ncbi:MAG: protein-signal peptide and transmembrane prediction, partial [Fimbriiglobus sp.]|nr:protein-signal peptide and transmembrane prediction [Fimbriiglobus sp.]
MARLFALTLIFTSLGVAVFTFAPAADAPHALVLTLRSRTTAPGEPAVPPTESTVKWEPKHTAIIVCDMWDQHWCKSAEE